MKYNLFRVTMAESASNAVGEVLRSGMIGEGPKVIEFKKKLEDRFKCKNLIPLNSGTSAITMALRLAGVGYGDEVITTPFTMIATNVAIKSVGAEPIFADIEQDSVNLSLEDVVKKITSKTKAIVVTLVGGIPGDMDNFSQLGIPIIVDAAHAVDTYYWGKHISHWGDFVCFSFQSIKQLTTGDGGAIVIRDDELYKKGEKLKWFGMSREVPEGMTRLEHQMTADVEDWGYKMHMNDISAAIGLANLPGLDWVTKFQRANAELYLKLLKGVVKLPYIEEDSLSSWWLFYIFVDDRKSFMEKMAKRGIETTPMWRRNDEYSVFNDTPKDPLPNMTALQDKVVFLPVGWWLDEGDIQYIADSVKECI